MSGDQNCQCLLLCLDNIIVFSSDIDQHFSRLEIISSQLQREGLKVIKHVQYLSHLVSTDPDKVSAVAKWPCLTFVSELHSFPDFANYRRFIQGFSKMAGQLQ